jgi:hypothetical protein
MKKTLVKGPIYRGPIFRKFSDEKWEAIEQEIGAVRHFRV